jgi:hypothetical protein
MGLPKLESGTVLPCLRLYGSSTASMTGIEMPEPDKNLPENSKVNLDRKLDHAIEETFPTSDPVSVTITKGGANDYDSDQPAPTAKRSRAEQGHATAEDYVRQAQETLEKVTAAPTDTARAAYERGRHYAEAVRQRYPEARRYYRERSQSVHEYAAENPLLTFLAGISIGYALAWMVHSVRPDPSKPLPEYARTRQSYSRPYPQPRA